MDKKQVVRTLGITGAVITTIAILQELSKPREGRSWHGNVAGFIPYDFRLPAFRRIKEAYWNPYRSQVLTPPSFGIGWAVNLYTLIEKMGLFILPDVSEEHFLMPTASIREVLKPYPTRIGTP